MAKGEQKGNRETKKTKKEKPKTIAAAPSQKTGGWQPTQGGRYKDPEPLKGLPEVQRAILANASRYVRPGGILLYSTCTLLPRENEEVVRWFLEEHKDFKAEAFTLPGPVGTAADGLVTLLPHRHGTDGFFICRMRREGRADG